MTSPPIAIVGRGCVLPDALNVPEFSRVILQGRQTFNPANADNWSAILSQVLKSAKDYELDTAYSAAGSRVRNFESGFSNKNLLLSSADWEACHEGNVITRWLIDAGRQALLDSGFTDFERLPKTGVIMGNLSYPTQAHNHLALQYWLKKQNNQELNRVLPHIINKPLHYSDRFSTGLPIATMANALGCRAGSMALDAACASSLYAIKYACDRLHSGEADFMLAGAVNAADNLFLHIGFSALGALSKSGRCLPFQKAADGLLPAEGCVAFALCRLDDALERNLEIHGVIRGVGLSNDGNRGGFLNPSTRGQVEAIKKAYQQAQIDPNKVSFLECHATGTDVGDKTELQSISQVFQQKSLILGSLKANMGHLITAAGGAGLLKILLAMKEKTLPPTPVRGELLDELGTHHLSINQAVIPWEPDTGRIAAINAFGFGGNNAHLIVEQWVGQGVPQGKENSRPTARPATSTQPQLIAITNVAVHSGKANTTQEFVHQLFRKYQHQQDIHRVDEFSLDLRSLNTPPKDLKQALGQQLQLLLATMEATKDLELDPKRSAIYVGMGCDSEISRHSGRWRLGSYMEQALGKPMDASWLQQACDAFMRPCDSARVIGAMPNICANRISQLLNLQACAITIGAEENSGLAALEIAQQALLNNEIDTAIVAAVDLSNEPLHQKVAETLLPPNRHVAGDTSVVLILKRRKDCESNNQAMDAVIKQATNHDMGATELDLELDQSKPGLSLRFGHAHASSGLLLVASAALALRHRAKPHPAEAATHWFPGAQPRLARIRVTDMSGERRQVLLEQVHPAKPKNKGHPAKYNRGYDPENIQLFYYAANDREELIHKIENHLPGGNGALRLSFCSNESKPTLKAGKLHKLAQQLLAKNTIAEHNNFHYAESKINGDVAMVFNGTAASYGGMGKELFLAVPELTDRLAMRTQSMSQYPNCLQTGRNAAQLNAMELVFSSTLYSLLHTEWTVGIADMKVQAAIGISAGESNSLFALGAWQDLDDILHDLSHSDFCGPGLGPPYKVLQHAWQSAGLISEGDRIDFGSWRILHPVAELKNILHGKQPWIRITIIHTDNDCIISGDKNHCLACIKKYKLNATPVNFDLSVHTPDTAAYKNSWYKLHKRKTQAIPGVRFYSNATNKAYLPTTESAAEAIAQQGVNLVNFPLTVKQAYKDGCRIFVEHGPRNLCCQWIDEILKDQAHVCIAMDEPGNNSLQQALNLIAKLWVIGVELNIENVCNALANTIPATNKSAEPQLKTAENIRIHVAAHPDAVILPPLPNTVEPGLHKGQNQQPVSMPAAPKLPPILGSQSNTDTEKRATPPKHQSATQAATQAATKVSRPVNTVAAESQSLAVAETITSAHENYLASMNDLAQDLSRSNELYRQLVTKCAGIARQAAAHKLEELTDTSINIPMIAAEMLNVEARVKDPETAAQQGKAAEPHAAIHPATHTAPHAATHTEPYAATYAVPHVATHAATQAATTPAPLTPITPGKKDLQQLPGPKWNRQDLETLASGKISAVFGPLFQQQDTFKRQVRMPMPPLLLADRVTGLDAEAGSMGTGTIWTETDIRQDSWYLHHGHIPAGIMVEAGQADLLLISYLGIDFLNRNQRVYRLLGCELSYHNGLAKPGDTLRYEIHIDGHASHGDVRLFFFHYDCHINDRLHMRVRQGQAGFFSDHELDISEGVLWSADEIKFDSSTDFDPAIITQYKPQLDQEDIRQFSLGQVANCFGESYARANTHTRSPSIPTGNMLLLDRVTAIDHKGGPCSRGYLQAELDLSAESWFYQGHFKNDPCMPGTLMAEGCLQAMAVFLTSLGYTLDKDGWRFEPLPDKTFKLLCRGQATPKNRKLVYEVFVTCVSNSAKPYIVADVLCSVDGLKAFHGEGMALSLVPGWPMETMSLPAQDPQATCSGDIRGDYRAMLSCAIGRPSDAFGDAYRYFDQSGIPVPRLPGPPYLFISRLSKMPESAGTLTSGGEIQAQFDIDPDAWFFSANPAPVLPYCVLLEATLQPCGWLATFCIAGTREQELCFRNLDGSGTIKAEVQREAGMLQTRVKQTQLSESAGMIIVGFDVECRQASKLIYQFHTVFGFFPPESMKQQSGIGEDPLMSQLMQDTESEIPAIDLSSQPKSYFHGSCCLPSPPLLMLDRITGFWDQGGQNKLGALRSEKQVKTTDWFFKAHFFQDPVQPGSLGLEAMLQLLQFYMLHTGMHNDIPHPRFQAIAVDQTMDWKYRGQVVPENNLITLTMEITKKHLANSSTNESAEAIANASLWVDGLRIYHATGLGMRIVSQPTPGTRTQQQAKRIISTDLDPKQNAWLQDHKPTYCSATMPMMSIVDLLAGQAQPDNEYKLVTGISNFQVYRWLLCDRKRQLQTHIESIDPHSRRLKLYADQNKDPGTELIASGDIVYSSSWPDSPAPLPALEKSKEEPNPYEMGHLFHGPTFQYLKSLWFDAGGSSAILDTKAGRVPMGSLHQGLLDTALHIIPNDTMLRWCGETARNKVAYPTRLPGMRFFRAAPKKGLLRAEARFIGIKNNLVSTRVQLIHQDKVWMECTIESILMPMQAFNRHGALGRRDFLRDKKFVPGIRLSKGGKHFSQLERKILAEVDWLPGTLDKTYNLDPDSGDRAINIVVKEHVAQRFKVHPSKIDCLPGSTQARCDNLPLNIYHIKSQTEHDTVIVHDDPGYRLDQRKFSQYWQAFAPANSPVENILWALANRCTGKIYMHNPAVIYQQPAIYLCNHQVTVESLCFHTSMNAYCKNPLQLIHQPAFYNSWLGQLLQHCSQYPNFKQKHNPIHINAPESQNLLQDHEKLLGQIKQKKQKQSMVVLAEEPGTTSTGQATNSTHTPTTTWLDLAMELSYPIIPVKFYGALPEKISGALDFPFQFARQDYYIGGAISPDTLKKLDPNRRVKQVCHAINHLGPNPYHEQANPGDKIFEKAVKQWMQGYQCGQAQAVLACALLELAQENINPKLVRTLEQNPVSSGSAKEKQWYQKLGKMLFST